MKANTETMKQEDKQLLLKDICARLPHNPFVYSDGCKVECFHKLLGINGYDVRISHVNNEGFPLFIESWMRLEYIKPYLRPMESMTEEEIKEFRENSDFEEREAYEVRANGENKIVILQADCDLSATELDWLNAHHFDYRGLIEKGLALEAPDGMYKIE